MSNTQKDDRLQPIPQDDQEQPEVYGMTTGKDGLKLGRRAFLGTLGVGVLASASGSRKAWADEDTNGQSCGNLRAHTEVINSVTFSPDGKFLVSGSNDDTIKVWSVPEGKLLHTLKEHSNNIASVAISADGKLLASGSGDETIRIWSLPEMRPIKIFEGQKSSFQSVAISPDGEFLASASTDSVSDMPRVIRLWALPEGKLLHTINEEGVDSVAISPDGTLLVSGSESYSTINFWKLPEMEFLKSLDFAFRNPWDVGVYSLAFSPDGKILASGGGNEKGVRLWSVPDGQLLNIIKGNSAILRSIAFSPDGKLLAAGGGDQKTIELWSLPEGILLTTLTGHSQDFLGVQSLSISPDGSLLASADSQGAIKLWALPNGEPNWCLFDPDATAKDTEAREYKYITSESICVCNTVTVPAGTMLPGATCVCDTVQVGDYTPSSGGGGGHYWHPN